MSNLAVPYLASKWLHIQFLISIDEMKNLFNQLGDLFLFSMMGVHPIEEQHVSQERFFEAYGQYLTTIRSGEVIKDEAFRFFFTLAVTKTKEAIQEIDLGNGRGLVRPKFPVVQFQLHRFDYSPVDGKIRPMVFGRDTISWGLQCSYPQLFQNPETRNVEQALNYPNGSLFRSIQQWIRHNTLPTPIIIPNKKVNVPLRIGKECLEWVNNHKELIARGLRVQV
jgi:hypothetical protein